MRHGTALDLIQEQRYTCHQPVYEVVLVPDTFYRRDNAGMSTPPRVLGTKCGW